MPKKVQRNRIQLTDNVFLEGSAFDWVVVTRSEGVNDKTGKPKAYERKHYFPRLTQVATHLVNEYAKTADTVDSLIEAINQSTQNITQALVGVENRLIQSGEQVELVDMKEENNGGSVDNDQTETSTEAKPASTGTRTRRRRRKKA